MPELIPPARNAGKCPREDNCFAVLLARDEAASAVAAEKCWRKKYEDMQGLANELYLAARFFLSLEATAPLASRKAALERLEEAVGAIADFAKKNKTNNQ